MSKCLYPYYNTEVLRAQPSFKVTLTPCHPALPLVPPVLMDSISLQESWALFSDHCDPSFLEFLHLALLGALPEPRLKESPATHFTTIVLTPSALQWNPWPGCGGCGYHPWMCKWRPYQLAHAGKLETPYLKDRPLLLCWGLLAFPAS